MWAPLPRPGPSIRCWLTTATPRHPCHPGPPLQLLQPPVRPPPMRRCWLTTAFSESLINALSSLTNLSRWGVRVE